MTKKLLTLALILTPGPALAQPSILERLDQIEAKIAADQAKVEKELKAVRVNLDGVQVKLDDLHVVIDRVLARMDHQAATPKVQPNQQRVGNAWITEAPALTSQPWESVSAGNCANGNCSVPQRTFAPVRRVLFGRR